MNIVAYYEHLKNLHQNFVLKLYKNDINYLNMFFRGETLDHYIFNVMLNPFSPWDWTVFR